jgi:hypothetical protein
MAHTSTATIARQRLRRPPHRLALLAAVCTLALSTCASGLAVSQDERQLTSEDALLVSQSRVVDPDPMPERRTELAPPSLPSHGMEQAGAGIDDVDEPELPEITFEPVAVQRPKIRLEGTPAVEDVVGTAMQVEGVSFATAVHIDRVPLQTDKGVADVTIAAVDPTAFRHFTPQVTADAVDVWRRIVEGDAAFTHDVGHNNALQLGSRVPLADRDETVRVGAYASNGVPPVADAVVSRETADQLGLGGGLHVYVSLADDLDAEQIAPQLASALGLEAEVLSEPPTRRAFLTGAAARDSFEPFTYISNGDGMIQIDPDWVRRNIVSARVPIFRGNVICHRQLIPQLRGALQEVVDSGLDHLIDPSQYGGCWVPRHILFNPRRGLSMHAWGLAVDFNVKGNEYGNRNPEMDPRIVEIFERWGFAWGGHWSTPDGMHFELAALLQSPPD